MDLRTRSFLTTAEENLLIARELLATPDQPRSHRRWVAIAAFYSAVHFVNAYIRERLSIEPSVHNERRSLVVAEAVLRVVAIEYVRLQRHGYDARYDPEYRFGERETRDLIEHDLMQIRGIVVAALEPVPSEETPASS